MNIKKILNRINALSNVMSGKSDIELKNQTVKLKKKIIEGSSEKKIIIEAMATIREANFRVLGMYATNEQIMAAVYLFYGEITEVKTGEGKSLIATFPLYTQALYNKKTFFITTNDYLSSRDFIRIGKVYTWLGVSVSETFIANRDDMDAKEFIQKKKEIYSAQIVYSSNGTFAFDFLINDLSQGKENLFFPSQDYALLDEVDDILLDKSQNPLVISGKSAVQSNFFNLANNFVDSLKKDHFQISDDGKSVWLTELGIKYANKYFSTSNILDRDWFEIYKHIILALKAHFVLMRQRDYLIEKGKIKLIDRIDGRILEGTNLQNGMQQSLEAKEGIELSNEKKIIASITYQNLFRKFSILSGMSGTVKIAEEEFISKYNLSVKKIPSHKKSNRIDNKTRYYVTNRVKILELLKIVEKIHKTRQPILVISGSVEASELISLHLLDKEIPHNLLNAKNSFKEAMIVKDAGRVGNITIATSMAGRGTDIKLDNESIRLGGLYIIISDIMVNTRMEIQAKGRAGRQGEPGETLSFASLEDDLIKYNYKKKIFKYYLKHYTSNRKISPMRARIWFKEARELAEERSEIQRNRTLELEETIAIQKTYYDKAKEKILNVKNSAALLKIVDEQLDFMLNDFFDTSIKKEEADFVRFILDNISYNFKGNFLVSDNDVDNKNAIKQIFYASLSEKQNYINDEGAFTNFIKSAIIKSINDGWGVQLNVLNQMKLLISTRVFVEKNIIIEYDKEASTSYEARRREIGKSIINNLALAMITKNKIELSVIYP